VLLPPACAAIAAGLFTRALVSVEREQRLRALRDPLTGLGNRAALAAGVAVLWQPRRGEVTQAVLLIDIDHFKQINDVHGHGSGDAVLARVGRRLERIAPGRAFRLGGEEFAVLVADCDRPAAQRLAEAVRADLARPGDDGLRVTVSIGVAMGDEAGDSFDERLTSADVALYAAKRAGRDRVVFAQDAQSMRESAWASLCAREPVAAAL